MSTPDPKQTRQTFRPTAAFDLAGMAALILSCLPHCPYRSAEADGLSFRRLWSRQAKPIRQVHCSFRLSRLPGRDFTGWNLCSSANRMNASADFALMSRRQNVLLASSVLEYHFAPTTRRRSLRGCYHYTHRSASRASAIIATALLRTAAT